MAALLPVGTRKGLFLLRGEAGRSDWKVEGPLLPGWAVYHAIVDPRDGLYAATTASTPAPGAGSTSRSASRPRSRSWAR